MSEPSGLLSPDSAADRALISWDRKACATPVLSVDPLPRCLWFHGFIANRRELCQQLGQPETLSDASLLAAVYQRYGDRTAESIAGPCAWIVWDPGRGSLTAVRDRLGIRTLYYRIDGPRISLSARIEDLLGNPGPPLNPRSIVAQIHGEAPPPGETFFQGISALEPGESLVVTSDLLETSRYWRIGPRPLLKLPDDSTYAEVFRLSFSRIVGEYLPPGPLGITLSGGMDSTTTAATVRMIAPDFPLTAFSWVSPELPEADESEAAARVAGRLGCAAVPIPADQHWPLRNLPGIRPLPDSPFLNIYSELWDATFATVREHGVFHLFSGLSGDHLFGGNVFSYPDLLLTGRWAKLGAEVRAHLGYSQIGGIGIVRRMILSPLKRSLSRFPRATPFVDWLRDPHRDLRPGPLALSRRLLPGRRERLAVLRDPLLPHIASGATAQAALYGIDFRHPLLDHRLFELAASLPTTQTFSAGIRKIILRNAMRGRLPDEILDRRDKTYPEAIARRGLAERETAKVWELMTDMRAAEMGFVDEVRLREEYRRFLARETRSGLFWHTLTLEAWLRQYFS